MSNNNSIFINYDIDKDLLVDIINDYFQNLPINQPKIINSYTFIEHWEILNEFYVINNTTSKTTSKRMDNGEKIIEKIIILNHLHFGKNDSQFMSSVKYFIDLKYKNDIKLISNFNSYSINREKQNKKDLDTYYDLVTCDDIFDVEINGKKLWNIESDFEEDTINSSFDLKDKDYLVKVIKDFEYYEFEKIYKVFLSLKQGGSCYIKHVALPLNSYLYHTGHSECSGFFINYLYLYFQMFNKVILFRPLIIPNKSLEFYVIGIDFMGFDENINTIFINILNNFKLHQTIFKKESINDLFIEQINSFLNIVMNRYVKFEEIRGMLTFNIVNKQKINKNMLEIKNNKISEIFLNKR
jgi:hypothetical protein